MADSIKVGDPLPHFTTVDSEGFKILDEDIVGYPIVLFFYPKNESEKTINQVLSFKEHMEKFDEMRTIVIGISPDSVEAHQKFIKEHELNFSLFSDPKKEMCKNFDVIVQGKFYRSTFVIDSDGVIQWIEKPVKLDGHVMRVLEVVKKHPIHRLEIKSVAQQYEEFLKESGKKKKKND